LLEGFEERGEVDLCEIEEVFVSTKREKRAEKSYWSDLEFSAISIGWKGVGPKTEGFWDFLSFLEIEVMRVGE